MTKKSTHSRAEKQTVAEEKPTPEGDAHAHEDEAVAEPTADVVEEPTETVDAAPEASPGPVEVADKGYCDNHSDREAVLVVNVPWTTTQRFCNLCIPSQYRYLMP